MVTRLFAPPTRPQRAWPALALTIWLAVVSGSVSAQTPQLRPSPLVLDRVFMVVRHGIRAPLDHEAAAEQLADGSWPRWQVANSQLTPHGRADVGLSGTYFRQWLIQQGLLPTHGCLASARFRLNSNTDQRTIDSAQLLGQALLPGCDFTLEHQPLGSNDPLYRPVESGVISFDPTTAINAIQRETHGLDHLVAQHRAEMVTLQNVLGCHQRCPFATLPSSLLPSSDGRSLRLDGPINLTSGTAEVLLLQYVQGFAPQSVGWGRLTPTRLAQLSRLHGLLFDVYAHPHYMATHSAALLSRELLKVLETKDPSSVPALSFFVGSDTQIAALSSVLGVHFHLPGFGIDDPSPGSALLVELWHQRDSGQRFVRLRYVGQSPEQLRQATPLSLETPPAQQILHSSMCPRQPSPTLCPVTVLTSRLRRDLVPIDTTNQAAFSSQRPVLTAISPHSSSQTSAR